MIRGKRCMANQELKKKRMLTYFIKAAQDIMNKEGIAGVTLRKVADGAGYNNATLYNYFEDLDHVILFASLKYLSLYNKKVEKALKGCISARERFFIMWDVFCEISFQYPDAFYQIFFNKHSSSLESICNRYYELFPEELPETSDTLYPIFSNYQLSTRNLMPLKELLEEENRSLEQIDTISELIVSAYHHLLHTQKIQKKQSPEDLKYYTEKMHHYICFILNLQPR